MNNKREVKRRNLRLYCQICGKHNHSTKDCWKDPVNAHKRPDSWKNDEELMTEIGIGADELVGDIGDDHLVGCA